MRKINKIVAIQADPLHLVNRKTDTTLLLATEAQRRSYKIYYYQTKDLSFVNNKVLATCKEVELNENKKKFYTIKNIRKVDLSKVQFILMRQNPPFNMNYITATYLLEKISHKTKILNDPAAVRGIPEKLSSIYFTRYMPPSIFTTDTKEIIKFRKKYKKIVIKPTHGFGGNHIFFVNSKTKINKITRYLKVNEHVMAQKFLPQIKQGDKRVFIIDGKVKGAIKRIPKKKSIVSNLGQGGTAVKTKLNKKEINVAKKVAYFLKKNNILFAGIDLVSNYLIGDINVTSPTGLRNFKDLSGIDLSVDVWNCLERYKKN